MPPPQLPRRRLWISIPGCEPLRFSSSSCSPLPLGARTIARSRTGVRRSTGRSTTRRRAPRAQRCSARAWSARVACRARGCGPGTLRARLPQAPASRPAARLQLGPRRMRAQIRPHGGLDVPMAAGSALPTLPSDIRGKLRVGDGGGLVRRARWPLRTRRASCTCFRVWGRHLDRALHRLRVDLSCREGAYSPDALPQRDVHEGYGLRLAGRINRTVGNLRQLGVRGRSAALTWRLHGPISC